MLHPAYRAGRARVYGRGGARNLVRRRDGSPAPGRDGGRRIRPPGSLAPFGRPGSRAPFLGSPFLAGDAGPAPPPDPRLRGPNEPGTRRCDPDRLCRPKRGPRPPRRRRRHPGHRRRGRGIPLRQSRRSRIDLVHRTVGQTIHLSHEPSVAVLFTGIRGRGMLRSPYTAPCIIVFGNARRATPRLRENRGTTTTYGWVRRDSPCWMLRVRGGFYSFPVCGALGLGDELHAHCRNLAVMSGTYGGTERGR